MGLIARRIGSIDWRHSRALGSVFSCERIVTCVREYVKKKEDFSMFTVPLNPDYTTLGLRSST